MVRMGLLMTLSRGEVSVEHWCSCGTHWLIEADATAPVIMLNQLLLTYHGLDSERHRPVSADKCRRARQRKARKLL